MMLVRNSMTTVESAFADLGTFEPSVMTADLLQQLEPTVTFIVRETEEPPQRPAARLRNDRRLLRHCHQLRAGHYLRVGQYLRRGRE